MLTPEEWELIRARALRDFDEELDAIRRRAEAAVAQKWSQVAERLDRDDPLRRETRCDRCHGPNLIAWWVDNDRWRVAMLAYGGTIREMAENPFLCPTCFTDLWEKVTGMTAIWHLVPEHIRWPEPQPTDEEPV